MRPRLHSWQQAASTLGTAVALLASPAGAQPTDSASLTAREAQSLLAIQRVANWLGRPIQVGPGLCTTTVYQGPWPEDGAPFDARSEDRLRNAWEMCARAPESAADAGAVSTRLVWQERASLQELAARLAGPHAALAHCHAHGPPAAFDACLAKAFGRPPTDAERAMALKLLASAD